MQASDARLLQGFAQQLLRQAVDLHIHLKGVDAPFRSRHFEVHVAQEVFYSLDVAQDGVLVAAAVSDEPHGNAGHRRHQRHSGIHQRHGRSADAPHGSGTVGCQDFADHANRVRKILFRRHRGQNCPLRQCAVPDFPPARGADAPRFPDAVGREIVVVHELLGVVRADGVQCLLHCQRCESGDGKHLGLASRKQAAAVGARQFADATGYGADFVQLSSVGPYVEV